MGEHLLFFVTSLGVVALIGVAAFAAFLVTCFAVGLGGFTVLSEDPIHPRRGLSEMIFWVALAVGSVVGLAVAVLMGRKLWGRKF